MTYREKLQKEHPERVDEKYVGGCACCPDFYGYRQPNRKTCDQYKSCKECWDSHIPGTEEDEKYKNLTADELRTVIKLLEGRIEVKDATIAKYTVACTDKNKEIENLKEQIKELEKRLDNADKTIGTFGRKIDELHARNRELISKITSMSFANSYLETQLRCKDAIIADLKAKLKE